MKSKIEDTGFQDPGESIAFHLRNTYRAIARAFEVETGQHEVDIGTWLFLRSLVREDGLTQKELIARTGLLQPGTSAAIKLMVARDLVTLKTDSEDRRKTRVYLTPKAKLLCLKVIPLAIKTRDQALKGFSVKDVDRLYEMLGKIRENLEPTEK